MGKDIIKIHYIKQPMNKHLRKLKFLAIRSKFRRQLSLPGRDIYSLDMTIPDLRHTQLSPSKKLRAIALRMLDCFHVFCANEGLCYCLGYGSLLGAVRHKGLIPWDDDIDLFMTRKSVQQLIAVCDKLPNSMVIKVMDYDFFKVMDRYSLISQDGKRGVALDIFIIDKNKSNWMLRNVHNQTYLHFTNSVFFPLIDLPFEGLSLKAPHDSHTVLKNIYGDYHILPPESERVPSHTSLDSIHIFDYVNTPKKKC